MKMIMTLLAIVLVGVSTLPSGVLHRHGDQMDVCAHLIELVQHLTCSDSHDHHHHGHGHHHHHHHDHSEHGHDAEDCHDHDADVDPVECDWLARQRQTLDDFQPAVDGDLSDFINDEAPREVSRQLVSTVCLMAPRPPPPDAIAGILEKNHGIRVFD